MTDFENAAFAVFVVLLSRAILYFKLNFYIPISKVDENMGRAQERDAAASRKFYFRKEVFLAVRSGASSDTSSSGASSPLDGSPRKKEKKLKNCFPPPQLPENGILDRLPVDEEYGEFTMNEIMNGKGENFPGLLPLVDAYLNTLEIDLDNMKKIQSYLELVRRRSNGTLLTPATWIRNFVQSHPDYQKDSVVSQVINYDLLLAVDEIERGVRSAADLLPEYYKGGDKDSESMGL